MIHTGVQRHRFADGNVQLKRIEGAGRRHCALAVGQRNALRRPQQLSERRFGQRLIQESAH
jgi:hypothetical protein